MKNELEENKVNMKRPMKLYLFIDSLKNREDLSSSYDLVIDAIFGFSFHGSPRAPFDSIITSINQSSLPVVSRTHIDFLSSYIDHALEFQCQN